ncbi:MAG: methyltransferase domain-containing protein [Coriobacteriales bacterium]|nr:methyltransferase domain-containing protein [Coriobacteriales bacterium]
MASACGCGTPVPYACLQRGERVLDLGCGTGDDVAQAAALVGEAGHVFGLDKSLEMLQRAVENAAVRELANVSFLEGAIESIPLADGSIDVVISNCVINLSHSRPAALREARRVLAPGGRFLAADLLVAKAGLPSEMATNAALVLGCSNELWTAEHYAQELEDAGFNMVSVEVFARVPWRQLEAQAHKTGHAGLLGTLDPFVVHDALASALVRGCA